MYKNYPMNWFLVKKLVLEKTNVKCNITNL